MKLEFPPHLLVLTIMVVGTSIWLGFFVNRHVEYSSELWWQFSLHGDASRFLRSLVAMGVLFIGFTFYRLLTYTTVSLELPDATMLDRSASVIAEANETMPHLALLGDKHLLWSNSGKSFLMFDTTPRFWVAMGEPVGPTSEHEELVWKFREIADRNGAKVAFYQVMSHNLPLYLDLGLSLLKLGEEARVPLDAFTLEGRARQGLRHTYNKCSKQGLQFEVVPAAQVQPLLGELRHISNAWVASKRAREKRFSLGFFDEAYLCRCAVAIIRKEGRMLAFANLWHVNSKDELSLDLMRYHPDSPNGVMEYLTTSLMLWGKEQGYRWFNLGMAPLSGLENHPLAPLWHKVGQSIFRLGGEFYNFEGLYNYKNKFDPVWQPRYLAAPSGIQVASTFIAVTSLISGGLEGVLKK